MAQPIDDLIAEVKDEETIADSVTVWVNGEQARLEAAVAASQALGATAAQLKPLTDELAILKPKMKAISDAILANTPATP